MAIARLAFACVALWRKVLGKGFKTQVERRGIRWNLDLSEGIDLAIYLMGCFEPGTVRAYSGIVKRGDTVLDIGANIGAHSLPLSKLVGPQGKVICFEPTGYAFDKLRTNVMLNPEFAARLDTHQVMLADDVQASPPPHGCFSSWPLRDVRGAHPYHGGKCKSISGCSVQRLDQFLAEAGVQHVDFVKLDVDGAELSVLRGGLQMLGDNKPTILLELAPYVYADNDSAFDDLLSLLWSHDYHLESTRNGRPLPMHSGTVRKLIPWGCSWNVIAFGR